MANQLLRKKIWFVWAVILLTFAGCSSKKTVTEKIVTKVDSTVVISLQTELSVKNAIIENLKTDLNRTREENTRLLSESSSHTINYDTGSPVNPQTGEHPKASETKTESKYQLEKTLKDMETLKQEYKKEVEALTLSKSNLEYELDMVKKENRELKTKSIPVFNLKSFLWGIATGAVLLLLLIFFLRRYVGHMVGVKVKF